MSRGAPARTEVRGDPLALLSRRVLVVVAAWLVACSVAAWLVVTREAAEPGMVDGLAVVGTRMSMPVAAPVFLATWVAMTVAMMFPTVIPLVAAHRIVARRRGDGLLPTVGLVAGYLLAWSLVGVVPLVALLGFRSLSEGAAESSWLPRLAGLALAVAGLYQFGRWKTACLRTCRSPMAFLARHDFGGGTRSAVRAGIAQGAYCIGCCWALMSVLLVVGLMNLVWMVALTLVFLAEKCWRHGWALPRVVGTALVVAGVAIAVHPPLLPALAGLSAGG